MTARQAWKPLLAAAMAAMGVAGLGALSTDLGPWYQSLQQPAWKPPDRLFGPAWTIIYALAALAGARAWKAAPGRPEREWLIALFALNGFLNLLWSLLFFRLRRPDWALFEVGFLWTSVLLLMVVLGRYARASRWLLAPYLVWVSIAATLNFAVVRLNGPFGAG
jgi:tryptophan-rich sensory protein